MPSIFRRTIMYLGLAPEAAYEEAQEMSYEQLPNDQHDLNPQPQMSPQPYPEQGYDMGQSMKTAYEMEGISDVRPYEIANPASDPAYPVPLHVEPVTAPPGLGNQAEPSTFAATNSQPIVIAPNVFDDAQHVADRFQNSQSIILNLQGLDRELTRRLLDFTSGLCYGLGGTMSKVANQVYMLVPAGVELSDQARQQFQISGH